MAPLCQVPLHQQVAAACGTNPHFTAMRHCIKSKLLLLPLLKSNKRSKGAATLADDVELMKPLPDKRACCTALLPNGLRVLLVVRLHRLTPLPPLSLPPSSACRAFIKRSAPPLPPSLLPPLCKASLCEQALPLSPSLPPCFSAMHTH